MSIHKFFAIGLLVLSISSCKKSDNQQPGSTDAPKFEKVFDKTVTEGNLQASDFVELSDGNLVVLADERNGLQSQLVLVKMEASGRIIWTKKYNNTSEQYYTNYAYSIQKDGADNIYVNSAAVPSNSDGRAWIFKADKNGNIIWERIFSYNITKEGSYGGGNYVVADNGTSYVLYNPSEGQQNACKLIILQADGSNLRTVDIPNVVYAGEIKATANRNLIIAGVNFDASRNTKIVLTKIDSFGEVIWQKNTNSQPGNQHVHGMVEMDNAFYLTGHYAGSNSKMRDYLFAKFNPERTLINMSNFGSDYDDVGLVVEAISNKRLVIGGYSQTSRDSYDLIGNLYINLVDQDGKLLKQDNLEGSGRIIGLRKSADNHTLIALGDQGKSFRILKYNY